MGNLGPDEAFWIDGEWVSLWDFPDPDDRGEGRLAELEAEAEIRFRYPKAQDYALIPYFRELLAIAQAFHRDTRRHLNVYGDLGELFGAINFGIKLHRAYAQGSDGRLGDDLVEIKTITPFKNLDAVKIDKSGNFSKLLVVKINEDFHISGRMIDRKDLPKREGRYQLVRWEDLPRQA